ncbi:MAG: Asd/ArgC dimerization domain-containing protein [Pyrinomonadaceae bacterium]
MKSVIATTLQLISGAGYPRVASLDITGNVVPFIGDEEEKIEQEMLKIFCNENQWCRAGSDSCDRAILPE